MGVQRMRTTRRRGALLGAAAALAVVMSAQSASADVNLTVPGESPGVPAYARVEPGGVFHTGQWAAVPFYRLPTCVPEDFNLMTFFDVPRAFGCPLTVSGHEVWDNGPGQEPAPNLAVLRGTGVPVWFASADEVQAAMSDGVLTIAELSGLDSLVIGTADRYQEVLHPNERIVINAGGTLSDGRSFRLHATYAVGDLAPRDQIDIR
jgi:hypothetical protein